MAHCHKTNFAFVLTMQRSVEIHLITGNESSEHFACYRQMQLSGIVSTWRHFGCFQNVQYSHSRCRTDGRAHVADASGCCTCQLILLKPALPKHTARTLLRWHYLQTVTERLNLSKHALPEIAFSTFFCNSSICDEILEMLFLQTNVFNKTYESKAIAE